MLQAVVLLCHPRPEAVVALLHLKLSFVQGDGHADVLLYDFAFFFKLGLLPVVPLLYIVHHPQGFHFSVFGTINKLQLLRLVNYSIHALDFVFNLLALLLVFLPRVVQVDFNLVLPTLHLQLSLFDLLIPPFFKFLLVLLNFILVDQVPFPCFFVTFFEPPPELLDVWNFREVFFDPFSL